MNIKDYAAMEERCSNCSYCKFIPFDKVKSARFSECCPSIGYYNFNTYSARGRFQLGLAVGRGELEATDENARLIHTCLSCGACDVSCKVCRYNLEPLEHNIALKEEAIKQNGPLPAQARMLASLKTEKTLLPGMKKQNRMDWTEGLEFSGESETLFFPGCKYSYTPALRKTVRRIVEVLTKAGGKMAYLGNGDICCAGRLYQMGLIEEFEERAKLNIKLLKSKNYKMIVTPCSDCYHAFKRLYAKLGLEIEVLHAVEYLDRLISKGAVKFTKELPLQVTYHDPCHLGRQGEPYVYWDGHEKKILNQVHTWEPRRPRYNGAYGIYDAPRRVLKAIPGLQLIEMERIREYSWCCGAGGGCSETDPEMSKWTASERIAEARATEAKVLVTACPWCKSNFDAVGGIEVADLFDLVALAL